jgi:RNA polymerase sigma factor (sigma-70 family)
MAGIDGIFWLSRAQEGPRNPSYALFLWVLYDQRLDRCDQGHDTQPMLRVASVSVSDEILAACIAGQGGGHDPQSAFLELYQRHARPLLAFLASRGARDDFEDLGQEIWKRVWDHLRRPGRNEDKAQHFRGWDFTIARNLLSDRIRRRRDTAELPEELAEKNPEEPFETLIEQERKQILAGCLEKLENHEPLQARVFRLRLGGEDYEEVRSTLNLAEKEAYRLFFAAKKQIQECVDRANP